MTSTNTYSYAPSAADIVANAYAMIQMRRPDLQATHLIDAAEQANMLMVDISNRNPNRWLMETQTQVLSATSVYTLSARTLAIALATITTTSGGQTLARVLGPISATEYAAIPNKAQVAAPSCYFFNLQTTPTISIWPVPDAATLAAVGTLTLTTFRQIQDVDLQNAHNFDAPYRFLDAITTGLAYRLAELYPDAILKAKGPQAIDRLLGLYEQRLTLAKSRDQERAPFYLTPGLSGYFR